MDNLHNSPDEYHVYEHEELVDWPKDSLDSLDKGKISRTSPLVIAQFLERLTVDEARAVLRPLSITLAADILSEMDEEFAADILASMREGRAVSIIDDFDADDAADIVAELDVAVQDRLLRKLERSSRDSIENLMSYDPDSAGGMMTTEVDTAFDDTYVDEAISIIRKFADKHEDLHYVYVVDRQHHLKGIVSLRKLIQAKPDQRIASIMRTDIHGVCSPEMDKEDVSLLMAEYNLPDTAVVDNNGVLLGVITHDDVLDVVRDEATEDIQKLAGAGGDESIHDKVLFSLRRRQPWLAVNLVTAFAAASVVKLFQDQIQALPVLAAVMPIIAGVGGNSGQQSLAVTIRSIALGDFKDGDGRKVLIRQALIGAFNGCVIGVMAAIMVTLFGGPPMLSIVVFMAMIANLLLGCLTGTIVPMLLLKMKQDPAQVSSILLTFITDSGGFLLFLTLGSIFVV